MRISDYQEQAKKTSGAYGEGQTPERQLLAALALAGEVGELCNLLKKDLGHGHDISDERYYEELGDILWYMAELATSLGLDLEIAAFKNVVKLAKRYPHGFNQEASINREKSAHG